MTRSDKLKPNSDPSCDQNRQITKKCKAKNQAKPTKGKHLQKQILYPDKLSFSLQQDPRNRIYILSAP